MANRCFSSSRSKKTDLQLLSVGPRILCLDKLSYSSERKIKTKGINSRLSLKELLKDIL